LNQLKSELQFGFVETRRLKAVMEAMGLGSGLVEGLLDVVDCRRQGLSFLATLWDYIKSY
jgi:hypothetical protein